MGTIVSALFLVTAGLFVYAFLKGRTPYATAIAFGLFGGAAMVFVSRLGSQMVGARSERVRVARISRH